MARIEMRHIRKAFPGVLALDDVCLSAQAGEVHALVGENGAGKSTLMKVLSGVYDDYDGTILVDGSPLRFRSPREAERAGIAIIHQELNLVRSLSVAENVFLGREPLTRYGLVDFPRLARDAAAILAELGAAIDPRAPVSSLRIGEQQIVEIAKALSLRARVLIMDEPTSALSDNETESLFEVVRSLARRGVTVLYISHKMDELFAVADRFTVLRDGRLVGTRRCDEVDADAIIGMMVGRDLGEYFRRSGHATAEPLLELRDLSVPHPDKPGAMLLERISFTLHRGEILGIAGLLGAGRTELLEAVFGVLPYPVEGAIRVAGRTVAPGRVREAIRAGLGLVTEDRKTLGLVEEMSVAANVTLASLGRFVRGGLLRADLEQQAVDDAVERLRIKTRDTRAQVRTLSGGNQQKVIVSRWLATRPRVLLLDEPTRGIDIGAKAEMYRLMGELAAGGIGIVMVSSELPEVLSMSDRILVMCEGRITGELDGACATEEAVMRLATAFRGARPVGERCA